MSLLLIVVGKDETDLAAFHTAGAVAEASEVRLINNKDRQHGGLGTIINRHLDTEPNRVVGVVHADTHFEPGALTRLWTLAEEEKCITGLVGRALNGDYVWGKDLPEGTVREVSTLDSCSIFIPQEVSQYIDCDEKTFDGFHCCVEDFCLQAYADGHKIVVPDCKASHVGQTTEHPDWQAEYYRYRAKLQQKWNHINFVTT